MSYTIITIINLLFQIFAALILIEVLGSWIVASRVHLPGWVFTILRAIHALTAPILDPIRRFIPGMGGLDLSPLIALVLLQLLRQIIVGVLMGR